MLPKAFELKANTNQGGLAPAWAKANQWPSWTKEQQALWKEPGIEMDRITSLEQVKKFLLLAGWTEDDQEVKDATEKLEAAKQLSLIPIGRGRRSE